MAKSDYPKVLWPAIELIERQQAIINALTARVNELSEAVLTDAEPISADGIGIESVAMPAPTAKSSSTAQASTANAAPAPAPAPNAHEVEETAMLAPDVYTDDCNSYYFAPDTLNIFEGKYELKVGELEGSFVLCNDDNAQFSFIYDTQSSVDPVAEYSEKLEEFGGNPDYMVKTLIPGRISLNNGQWVIKQKAKVSFIKKSK